MPDKNDSKPKLDPQSGQTGEEKPKAATAARKAATEEQFAEADKKGSPKGPTQEEIDAATLGRSIRGW